jgi:hypothetical protein
MPSHRGWRPLKAWRYVGFFSQGLMICLTRVRLGPARECFWAVWDRDQGRLLQAARGVELAPGAAAIRDRAVRVELALDESPGLETVCPAGEAYAWTRKQGGIRATGRAWLRGDVHELDGRAIIDDTGAYYERHTHWRWCAGVGDLSDGRPVAWNLVEGVNDPPLGSERTVWVDGAPLEPPPVAIAGDLSGAAELRFAPEATLARDRNLFVVRSRYRQPFGRFSGALPGGLELASGLGVMEDHDAWW